MTTAEDILASTITALVTVTELGSRIYEHNPANPPSLATTPVAIVRFASIEPQNGFREQEMGVEVDVYVDRAYYEPLGIGPQRALARLHKAIVSAMFQARYATPNHLQHCSFGGSSLIQEEDGQTRNGLTLSFRAKYTEVTLT